MGPSTSVALHCVEVYSLDAMKFHHLGQILLDTNCLLLILKMLGLQEISQTVVSKADSPDNKYVTPVPIFCHILYLKQSKPF